jgi:serine protease AprX
MKYIFAALVAAVLVASTQIGYSVNSTTWQKKLGINVREVTSATDVIVVLKEKADLTRASQMRSKNLKGTFVVGALRSVADRTQADLIEFLKSRAIQFKSFYIVNAIAVRSASPALIEELAKRDEVAKIVADPIIRDKAIVSRVRGTASLVRGVGVNITSTGAEAVWAMGIKGADIVVAGQDTGVDWTHPALINHYRGSARGGGASHEGNWHDSIRESISGGTNRCGLNLAEPCDDHGHGTHTVGTIVGNDGAENIIGMAPEAKWIACRNMESGYGKPSTYIECYEWFIAPYEQNSTAQSGDPSLAPHVINNSWGCPSSEGCTGAEIKPVLEALYAAGIMNVVSAGNEGPGCSSIADQPASISDFSFSVGAHNHRNNSIASFSSRGPSALDGKVGPDITAPGVSIRSSVPGGTYEEAFWSGTSMAGPHVAGAVALLWSAQPKLVGDIDRTVEILRSTAIPTVSSQTCGGVAGTEIPNNTFGYGLLNVEAAVKKALSL